MPQKKEAEKDEQERKKKEEREETLPTRLADIFSSLNVYPPQGGSFYGMKHIESECESRTPKKQGKNQQT